MSRESHEQYEKPERETTTYLLKWTKFRTLTTPGTGKDMEQQTLMRYWWECTMVPTTAIPENSLAVSYKIKHAITILHSNFTLEYLSQRNENIF